MRPRADILADLATCADEINALQPPVFSEGDTNYDRFNEYRRAHDVVRTRIDLLNNELEVFYLLNNERVRFAALQEALASLPPEESV